MENQGGRAEQESLKETSFKVDDALFLLHAATEPLQVTANDSPEVEDDGPRIVEMCQEAYPISHNLLSLSDGRDAKEDPNDGRDTANNWKSLAPLSALVVAEQKKPQMRPGGVMTPGMERIGVLWYCGYNGCQYGTKWKSHVKAHRANVHLIGVKWFPCADCGFQAKEQSKLKKHRAFKHGVDVMWFTCDIKGCDYKAKQKGNLKMHLADRHGRGLKWYNCSECDYKAKRFDNLRAHKKRMHRKM